jgi:pimeloyl-ACP methyl ester carboxylesterase
MHLIPHCDATVLAHCGHWPQLEMPERYNALCLQFLRSVT